MVMSNAWPAESHVHDGTTFGKVAYVCCLQDDFSCNGFCAGQDHEIEKLNNILSIEWAGHGSVVYTQPDALGRPARVHSVNFQILVPAACTPFPKTDDCKHALAWSNSQNTLQPIMGVVACIAQQTNEDLNLCSWVCCKRPKQCQPCCNTSASVSSYCGLD